MYSSNIASFTNKDSNLKTIFVEELTCSIEQSLKTVKNKVRGASRTNTNVGAVRTALQSLRVP